MADMIVTCVVNCLCRVICTAMCEACGELCSDSTFSSNRHRENKHGHSYNEESRVDYTPMPVAPMSSIELPISKSHQLTPIPSAPPSTGDFSEAELIISTNEASFTKANFNPQALFSSVQADAKANCLSLLLAKRKFKEYIESSDYNQIFIENLLKSLDNKGRCDSNLLSVAVILTGNCDQSAKAEMIFELYREKDDSMTITNSQVSRMVAQTYYVSVRHLPKLVQNSEKGINEVIMYCNKLEESMGVYTRKYASLVLGSKSSLSKSEFMEKIQDQFCFLLSASEIRKEALRNVTFIYQVGINISYFH